MNVVSSDDDATLAGIAARCSSVQRAGSLHDLCALLDKPVARSAPTLNLIGHSTRGHRYLRIGRTPIDMLDPRVRRCFEEIAISGVLRRRGIVGVRLLGCETAVEVAGQRTLACLARTLELPVFGTRKSLMKSHYDGTGFDSRFDRLLIESADLPHPRCRLG